MLALQRACRGAAGRSPGASRWPSARRPGCRERRSRATAPAPPRARPAPDPPPSPRRGPFAPGPRSDRADSILQTASMARCVSEAATPTDQNICQSARRARRERRRSPAIGGHAPIATRFESPQVRLRLLSGASCSSLNPAAASCTSGGKSAISCTWRISIISLSEAGQRLAHSIASSLRLHLDHPVPAEHFLRLGEGPVGDLGLSSAERDPRAHRRRVQSVERQQHPGLLQRLVVLHHRLHGLGDPASRRARPSRSPRGIISIMNRIVRSPWTYRVRPAGASRERARAGGRCEARVRPTATARRRSGTGCG